MNCKAYNRITLWIFAANRNEKPVAGQQPGV